MASTLVLNSLRSSWPASSILVCLRPGYGSLTITRGAKGSPGQSQGKPHKGRNLTLKYNPGTYVYDRKILVTQKGLKYHPGLNTAIDPRDNAIYSVCEGTMIITTEKVVPNLKHEIAEKYYSTLKGPMFKRYINVVAKKEDIKFRLIDLV